MHVHIGTSGWSYDHWHGGILYPDGISPQQRLEYYLKRFQTVELNSSYYRWPGQAAMARWHQRFPKGFIMSVKAPGLLTHHKKLYSPENWLARISQDMASLKYHQGVLLAQLPPTLPYDVARLTYFLEQLPSNLRIAMEFRHISWHQESVFALLAKHNVAYCVMSGANLPCILRATTDFVYVRLHGPDRNHMYAGSYSDNDLRWWSHRIREWASDQKREVFVYFNNDGNGHAVRNAETLRYFVSI